MLDITHIMLDITHICSPKITPFSLFIYIIIYLPTGELSIQANLIYINIYLLNVRYTNIYIQILENLGYINLSI